MRQSARSDPEARKTVYDLLQDVPSRVVPVGRLDLASSGLLILTNDTHFANWLSDPSSGVDRTGPGTPGLSHPIRSVRRRSSCRARGCGQSVLRSVHHARPPLHRGIRRSGPETAVVRRHVTRATPAAPSGPWSADIRPADCDQRRCRPDTSTPPAARHPATDLSSALFGWNVNPNARASSTTRSTRPGRA